MTERYYNKDKGNSLALLEREKLFIANRQFSEAEADLQRSRYLYGFDLPLTEEFDTARLCWKRESKSMHHHDGAVVIGRKISKTRSIVYGIYKRGNLH
jgi:hypothetical protein